MRFCLSIQGMDTGEELLVDIVDDADGSPRKQPMSWVVEEIGRAVGEVREKGPLSCSIGFRVSLEVKVDVNLTCDQIYSYVINTYQQSTCDLYVFMSLLLFWCWWRWSLL